MKFERKMVMVIELYKSNCPERFLDYVGEMFCESNCVRYGKDYFDFTDEECIEFNEWLNQNGIDLENEGYIILV